MILCKGKESPNARQGEWNLLCMGAREILQEAGSPSLANGTYHRMPARQPSLRDHLCTRFFFFFCIMRAGHFLPSVNHRHVLQPKQGR